MDEKGKMNTEKYEELIKEVEANSPYKRLSSAKKKWMSVSEIAGNGSITCIIGEDNEVKNSVILVKKWVSLKGMLKIYLHHAN